MKSNKYFLFMLILICSLININVTNSPIEIRNLEPVKDGKRRLDKQTDNYIIIEFVQTVVYGGMTFLHDYNKYMTFAKQGNEIIYTNNATDLPFPKFEGLTTNFLLMEEYKKIEIHFNQTLKDLSNFFSFEKDNNFANLISADFSHFDTSLVTDMNSMFRSCTLLKTLDLSNFNTSLVTNMGMMFAGCNYLQTLDLSNFNTSSVTDMSMMFIACFTLQTLNLSNFNTSLVTNMTLMFDGCSSLKYLIISNFNFDKVGGIDQIFEGLLNLQYIDIYDIKDYNNVFKNEVNEEHGLNNKNNKNNLTVCQNNSIFITNPNTIYSCCDIIDDILVCDNIQTTIPMTDTTLSTNQTTIIETTFLIIQTTIPPIQTTAPQIQTTIPIIQTTVPIIQTTIPIIQTTIPKIQTTVPFIQTTVPFIQTTIPKIQTTIPMIQTTIPIIQTTVPKIQTTIPKIQTTIPIIQTTIPLIHTTITQIQTTIPQIQTTISKIQTTIPQIKTTIPMIQTTIPIIQTTIPLIQTTIPRIQKTIPPIQKTIPKIQTTIPQIQATIPQIPTTSSKIKNEETSLFLLGFNHFLLTSSSVSFYVHFTKIFNEIKSRIMRVRLMMNYNERIRILEEKEVECYLKETNNKKISSFFCETDIKNPNIKQVKIIPKFDFVNQDNINIVDSSPIARMFMDNLQDIDDKYDNLENSFIYILDHSLYYKYSKYKYNITGIIDQEPISKLENKNINLMINLDSENEITIESNCTTIKINVSFYSLICEIKDNINLDLKSGFSSINDEEILIVNFDRKNSTITTNNTYEENEENEDNEEPEKHEEHEVYYSKNNHQIVLTQVKLLLLFCLLFWFWVLLLVLLFI